MYQEVVEKLLRPTSRVMPYMRSAEAFVDLDPNLIIQTSLSIVDWISTTARSFSTLETRTWTDTYPSDLTIRGFQSRHSPFSLGDSLSSSNLVLVVHREWEW